MHTLRDAIRDRRLIRMDYPPGLRILEPHALGRSSKGDLLLRAFQVDGVSESNQIVGWKLMRLDRARRIEMLDGEFDGPRPDYRKGDAAMRGGILAEL